MSEPTPPNDEVVKPKDRFAGVPSIEDTLASFAAGMQWAYEHPEEADRAQMEREARFVEILNKANKQEQENAPIAGGTFRCVSPLRAVLMDLDKSVAELDSRELPCGAVVTFGEFVHPFTHGVVISQVRDGGPKEWVPSNNLSQWFASEADVRANCVKLEPGT